MSEPGAVAEVDLDALTVQVEGLDLEENILDSGAHGVVYKVTVDGKKCTAKKLQNILIHVSKFYRHRLDDTISRKFHTECRIISQLKHPNVVGFVGVHYGRDRNDISLIMERLHCDLADFVKNNPDTPLCDRLRILYDVSEGLEYLHSQNPPLIHCDLTATNVLLTEDLKAKIGDLGVSRYIDPSVATKLAKNLYHLPPECQGEDPSYTTKLDIFSFGNIIIHTITGEAPDVREVSTDDPKLPQYIHEGKVELMRRHEAFHKKIGETHCLYPLVVCCLHDEPEQRPSVGEVRSSLKELCERHPTMTFIEACRTGNLKVVEEMLEGGADPNQQDEDGKPALCWAARKGHDEVVRTLIQTGARVTIKDKDGKNPLLVASFYGHPKCVQQLIETGANVNMVDEDGATALLAATQEGHCGIVKMLLEAEADTNAKASNEATPLYMASRMGHDEVVRLLLAAKATVNTQCQGETPLLTASSNGHKKCVQLLIDAGANVDVPNENGATALHMASQEAYSDVARMLVDAKADVNIKNSYGATALYMASQDGHYEVVRILLEAKADVNIETDRGFTTLHITCQEGHLKVAEAMIAAYASVDAPTRLGVTPLMLAAYHGHGSIIELLLSKGADPHLRNIKGDTAYDLARKQGHRQIYQQLIS